MNGTNSPAEIAQIWVGNGVKKAKLSVAKMLFLGIFAGMFIGFGAVAFIVATSPGGTAGEMIAQKFLGAAIFPAAAFTGGAHDRPRKWVDHNLKIY